MRAHAGTCSTTQKYTYAYADINSSHLRAVVLGVDAERVDIEWRSRLFDCNSPGQERRGAAKKESVLLYIF